MGRRSVKENKTVYQESREKLELTRQEAAELIGFLSADRIEKIESEKAVPYPEEVAAMAKAYKVPSLCNYYCTHTCRIGQECVSEVQLKDLSLITLEMLNSLNRLSKEKERLVEIMVDGLITEDEVADFRIIRRNLDEMQASIESLKLWINQMAAYGRIPDAVLED